MCRSSLALLVALAACGAPEPSRPPAAPSTDPVIFVPAGVVSTSRGAEHVAAYGLDRTPVTVAAFRSFVTTTGHVTLPERAGGSVLELSSGAWRVVAGASWERPLGADGPAAPDDHPVTQVSFPDATAFCAARGGRLPSEEEWEHAARNARDDRTAFPWGDHPAEGGVWRLNAWQGSFPAANTLADGHLFASPVGTFPPTPLGFVDLVGNVWEWTTSSFDGGEARALRGGSFLCEPSVCHGYRIDGRQEAEPTSGWMHVGFRCAYDR